MTATSPTSRRCLQALRPRKTEPGRELSDATLDRCHPDQFPHHSFARTVVVFPILFELDISLYDRGVPGQ